MNPTTLLALSLLVAPPAQIDPASAQANPVFLDGSQEVRVWLTSPLLLENLRPEEFTIAAGNQTIRATAITAGETAPPDADPNQIVLAASFQSELGGNDWDPNGQITKMTQTTEGVFQFAAFIPAGVYEYKVARGGSWATNWGRQFQPNGQNITLRVPAGGSNVQFIIDFNRNLILDSINNPSEVATPASVPAPMRPELRSELRSVTLRLERPLTTSEMVNDPALSFRGERRPLIAREILSQPQFKYSGNDLGNAWTPRQTTFKVWSPVARQATLLLAVNNNPTNLRRIPMTRGTAGVWYVSVPGNLDGQAYQYEFVSFGQTRRAADIYGRAAQFDSDFSVVLDMRRTNPAQWPARDPFGNRPQTDAIIYEFHIRDFTVHASSGVRPEWRGKYLGLTQTGTRAPGTNQLTGLDYLRDLGVTHVHLLPFQDFNPAHSKMYNWGYETTLFNVPEEQYSTKPNDPVATIRETKQMVAALQRNGIGVILDVVYNHSVPSEGPLSAFWQTVPGYYFRTNDAGFVLNESGVGNALHDERPMVRKFIRDSLVYWLREYKLDGYRFDLLGMFTPETVKDLTQAIRNEKPNAVLYGEPWTGGGPLRFQKGDQRNTTMAVFNDRFRGIFRNGLDTPEPGFAMGATLDRHAMTRAVTGFIDNGDGQTFTASPLESLNYVSAHDNLTWWDKVSLSLPEASLRPNSVKLSHAAVLLSQGVPFIEGGVNIGRTKGGNNNSYNAGDPVNQYRWDLVAPYTSVNNYFKGLIAIRRAHPAFRLTDAATVRRATSVLPEHLLPANTFAYTLDGQLAGDSWRNILVIFHGQTGRSTLTLPSGTWNVAVDHQRATNGTLRTASGTLTLEPLSAYVLWRR